MKWYAGSDHAGFRLKKVLVEALKNQKARWGADAVVTNEKALQFRETYEAAGKAAWNP